ncbi:hypothetical protein Tco_0495861 [Tanacetum coccineum]
MASLDHRLNPLFSIKECMTCGALYTADFCCSKGGLEDKILVPKPPQNCATCGNPVDGLYCRSCAFVRKCLNEGWYTIHDENKILNTYESSNHNTNIVSAPREPFVGNQDPGENSSQNPLQINNNCCYECGDSLDDIFCQRCTCKSCGKGAHFGYNCPPQIPIISNPEPCYNQNLNEILQNLQSLQQQSFLGTCQQCGCNEYDGVCFYCTVGNGTQINFSTPYSSNDSPNFANHPPQPQYETNICELCGNDAHHGYDCSPQVPFIYNQDPCSNQNFDYFPQTSPSFPQQCLCCENCGGPHATFQCQPMNQDFYLSGFDQYQPPQSSNIHPQHPQYTVHHPNLNVQKDLLQFSNKLMEKNDIILFDGFLSVIPSESEGIYDGMCDVPLCENPIPLKAFKNHFEIVVDLNNDGTSSDDDSYVNIEYVEASLLNLEYDSLEEVNEDQEEEECDLEYIEPDQGGLTSVVISDNSNDPLLELPEFESFHFDLDPSFPRPPPEPPDVEISLIVYPDDDRINKLMIYKDECFDPGGGDINVEVDKSFIFVTWTFLPFLTYPEVSPLPSSTKNEDTIFDLATPL